VKSTAGIFITLATALNKKTKFKEKQHYEKETNLSKRRIKRKRARTNKVG
jgi:hypothetical protein